MTKYDQFVEVAEKILDSMNLNIKPTHYTAYKNCLKTVFPLDSTHKKLSYKLGSYPQRVEGAKARKVDVDFDLVDDLLHKCKLLLLAYKDKWNEYETPFILAAVEYFLSDADAVPDFASPEGFVDDKEIIYAIIAHFKLEHVVEGSGIQIDTRRSLDQKKK